MKIGVVSDSHGDLNALRAAVSAAGKVDAWFHLGDGAGDILRIKTELGVPVYAVAGNCDYHCDAPKILETELSGKKFFLTHGDMFAVNFNTRLLSDEARLRGCDMALYGHTHLPDTEYGQVYILNPGSCARPFNNMPSCGIITIENNEIRMEIVDVNKVNKEKARV